MSGPTTGRPCRFCVAQWEGFGRRADLTTTVTITATDCEWAHRDRKPSDEQIAAYLGDADDVVDDFDPTPERWRVRRLPESAADGEQGIEIRLRISAVSGATSIAVTYVGLEGGKDTRGQMVRLSTFRSWGKS